MYISYDFQQEMIKILLFQTHLIMLDIYQRLIDLHEKSCQIDLIRKSGCKSGQLSKVKVVAKHTIKIL